MRKSNLTVWFLTLFVASWWGGVEPSNADVCFIVGGCDKPSIETKDCNSLGYKEKSCDGVKEIVYDTCVSKGEKFVKCTCNPNYYMLTERPTNEAAYDIEECTKIDGKKLYRATCKSDYKYTLSKITREDGETNSSVCSAGQTPVADGGICTMLYGANANNANKVLYKDCDCDSTYKYKKETPGFSYSGTCTYKYGDNAGETLYTTVTCDTGNYYQSTDCNSPKVVDDTTKVTNSQKKELSCWKCKCPATYQYPAQMQNGITGSNKECGTLWDEYTCPAKLLANCPSGAVCDTVRGATEAVSSAYNAKCYKCNLNVHKYLSSTDTTNYADFITFGGECKQDNISHYRDASCKSPYQSKDCASGYEKDGGDKILYTYNGVKTLSCWKCKKACPTGTYATADLCKNAGNADECVKNANTGCYRAYNCKTQYKAFPSSTTLQKCLSTKEVGQKCSHVGKLITEECYYSRNVSCTDFFGTGCTEKRDLAIATCEDGIEICLNNCSGNNCCCTAENNGYCEPVATYCAKMVGYTCEFQDVDRYYEGKKITLNCDLAVDLSTKKPNIPTDQCSKMNYEQTLAYCAEKGYSDKVDQNCVQWGDICPCTDAYAKCTKWKNK